jgi:hypothetical protein
MMYAVYFSDQQSYMNLRQQSLITLNNEIKKCMQQCFQPVCDTHVLQYVIRTHLGMHFLVRKGRWQNATKNYAINIESNARPTLSITRSCVNNRVHVQMSNPGSKLAKTLLHTKMYNMMQWQWPYNNNNNDKTWYWLCLLLNAWQSGTWHYQETYQIVQKCKSKLKYSHSFISDLRVHGHGQCHSHSLHMHNEWTFKILREIICCENFRTSAHKKMKPTDQLSVCQTPKVQVHFSDW